MTHTRRTPLPDLNHVTILDVETFLITDADLAPQLVAVGLLTGTERADLRVISGHAPEPGKHCAAYQGKDVFEQDPTENLLELLKHLFSDPHHLMVGHRICFDLGVILRWFSALTQTVFAAVHAGRVLDTRMTMAAIMNLDETAIQAAGLHDEGEIKALHLSACIRKFAPALDTGGKSHAGSWSTRFSDLYFCPPRAWPASAQQYLAHDLRGTQAVAVAQSVITGLVAVEIQTLDRHLTEVARRARTLP
jgi:hypothetical protein